ncbi:MAG: hypothetical protein GY749_08770 [Desulfobacteraceae bacterium]|nr:hypothetical protein [Desulfobacteraceae bacterium]
MMRYLSAKSGDITRLNYFLFNLISQLTNKSYIWAKHKGISATFDDPAWSDFEEGKEEASFYKYWNHLCKVAGEKRPIVMFDEIDRLLDRPGKLDKRILTFLKDFVGDPVNGYFILSGSERIQYKRRIPDYNGFRGGFNILKLLSHQLKTGPFSRV